MKNYEKIADFCNEDPVLFRQAFVAFAGLGAVKMKHLTPAISRNLDHGDPLQHRRFHRRCGEKFRVPAVLLLDEVLQTILGHPKQDIGIQQSRPIGKTFAVADIHQVPVFAAKVGVTAAARSQSLLPDMLPRLLSREMIHVLHVSSPPSNIRP